MPPNLLSENRPLRKRALRLSGVILISLAGIILPSDILCAEESLKAENYCLDAKTKLAQGDTAAAFKLLDKALQADKSHGPAWIDRGYLSLDTGNKKQAKIDFERALRSKSRSIKAKAYVGLGDVLRTNPKWIHQAMEKYRFALDVDPSCKEAFYSLAKAGMEYEQTVGYRVAAKTLVDLICLDPNYKDAYRLWRDKILDKTEKEIGRVDQTLESYLAAHPGSAAWWVDLAWDHFDLGEPEQALETLSRLKELNPDYNSPNLPLLEAQCKLELGDTLSFQRLYDKAVEIARETGDFSPLIIDAETIFTPEDYKNWEKLSDNKARAVFLRAFWQKINPDKLKEWNPRLAEHYARLRYAKKNYRLQMPHSPYQTKKSTNILLSFQSRHYEYKPEIFFNRSRQLALEQRGMLYIRYGPPDIIRTQHFMPGYRISNPAEFWHYGKLVFMFEKKAMAGDYIFRPMQLDGLVGDMMKAMETQRFQDKHIHKAEDSFWAQFAGADSARVELEIYQDEVLPEGRVPEAAMALFDTTWLELKRQQSPVFKTNAEENLWLAVHRITAPPGKCGYAMRIKADPDRWTGRGRVDLKTFKTKILDFSTVVLGAEPEPGGPAHERLGVKFVPRASMKFKQGEQIKVYLEVYNLRIGREGFRNYREWVDVIRLEEEKGMLGRIGSKLVDMLTFGKEKQGTSITHVFDRRAETRSGPVAETFFLDSSVLEPGQYRLLIEARDNASAYWDAEGVLFEITK
jgi:GWxTD domain-containing protein